jgi:uncharacterized membrane protein
MLTNEVATLNDRALNAAIWSVVALFGAYSLFLRAIGWTPLAPLSPLIVVGLMALFAVLHGSRQVGWKQLVVLFVLTFAVSWSYETTSIATGFPFGRYHYSAALGPKLGTVPLLIMPAYYVVAYISWHLGLILLDRFSDRRRDALATWVLPVIAAMIMVMWDLSMDPARSTRAGIWVWEQGGSYFGVPFSNFMGWLLCVWTIFQLYALYLRAFDPAAPIANPAFDHRENWYQVAGVWSGLTSEFLTFAAFPPSGDLVDRAGATWSASAMYVSLGLVSIFTMGFVAVLAWARVATTERLKG